MKCSLAGHRFDISQIFDPAERGAAPSLKPRLKFAALLDGAKTQTQHGWIVVVRSSVELRSAFRTENLGTSLATIRDLEISFCVTAQEFELLSGH